MEIWTEFTLECSHTLNQPIGSPQIHGHSYWVRVYFDSSEDDPVPLPMLEGYCRLLRNKMDHRHLNDFIEVPTMEAIAAYVANNVQHTPIRVDVERKSIGAGVTFYPGAHGASYWRARAEHYQAEAKNMAKSVDHAWRMVGIANQRLEANNIHAVTNTRENI